MRIGNEYPPFHSYKMNIHTLEYSKCEKDIGIIVDDKLKFDTHTSNKINKANKVMGVIRRTFDYMNKGCLYCYSKVWSDLT